MPDIKVAAGIFAFGMCAVAGQSQSSAEVPVSTNLIQRVRIRITGDHGQAVVVACCERHLQAVVVRTVNVRHLKNLAEVRELIEEGAAHLLAAVVQCRNHLIDVANARQLGTVVPDVAHLQR